MLPVVIEEINDIENKELTRVVCVAKYQDKFIKLSKVSNL